MPTTKFEADFSSFLAAADAATRSLKQIETSSEDVGKQMSSMADQFSGRQLIEQASMMTYAVKELGGVSKLTADEIEHVGDVTNTAVEKMRALGYEVPQGLQSLADATKSAKQETESFGGAWQTMTGMLGAFGVQATVSGVIGLIKDIANSASQIDNMANRLQTSTDNLQKFQAVASATGVPLEAMVRSIQDVQAKLGEGDTGLIASLRRYGISVEDLKNANAWQIFESIATAMAKIEDPQKRATAELEIFGGRGKVILPAMRDDVEKLAESTTKMSAESVGAWDRAAQAVSSFATSAKNSLANFLYEGTMSVSQKMADLVQTGMKQVAASTSESMQANVKQAYQVFTGVALSADAAMKELNSELKESGTQQKEAAKATAEHQKAIDAITIAGDGYKTVLDTVDGKVVEAIKWYREQGVTLGQLKEIYTDLSDVQLDAANKAAEQVKKDDEQKKKDLKFYDDLVKKDNAAYDEITKARNAFNDFESKQFEDSTTYKINKIYEEAEVAKQKYTEKYGYSKEYNDLVDSLAAERVRVESEAYDQEAQAAEAAYRRMANAAAGMTQEMIQSVEDQLNGVIGAFTTVGHAADDLKAKFAADFSSGPAGPMGGLPSNPEAGSLSTDPRITGLLSEGYTLAEAYAIVAGYGGSIVKPTSRQSGTGRGYFAGGGVTANITVNGSVLGNKDEIANAVSSSMTDYLKRMGYSLPGR